MARRGGAVYVLADSSKLGKRPFRAWVKIALSWTLVTDADADPGQVALFRKAGGAGAAGAGGAAGASSSCCWR